MVGHVCLEPSSLRHAEVRHNCPCLGVLLHSCLFYFSQINNACEGVLAKNYTWNSLQVGGNFLKLRLCTAHNQKGNVTVGALEEQNSLDIRRFQTKRFWGKQHFLTAWCNVFCHKTHLTFVSLYLFCFLFACFFFLHCSKHSMTDLWLKYPCTGRFWQCYNLRKTLSVTLASRCTSKSSAGGSSAVVKEK